MSRALPFFTCLLLFLLGLAFCWFLWRGYQKVAPSYQWPEVQSTIVSSELEPYLPPRASPTEYRVKLVHEYEFEGEKYESSKIHPQQKSFKHEAGAQAELDQYPVGEQVSAWVDAENPAQAVLQPEPSHQRAEVQSRILSSELESYSSSSGGFAQFRVNLVHQYEFADKIYESSKIRPRQKNYMRQADGQAEFDKYPVGEKFSAWVDPENPEQAVLQRDSKAMLYGMPMPLFLIALSLVGMYRSLFPRHQKAKQAGGVELAS